MAKNPDPDLKLASFKGATRTLDDWATMFHLAIVMLPDRPEASVWVRIAERMFAVLGDSDCRCAISVSGPESITHRVVGDATERVLVFVDAERELARSLGLEYLPAFVHLRQDTTLVAAAEGWDPRSWQRVANELATAMAWSSPTVRGTDDPPPTLGWPV